MDRPEPHHVLRYQGAGPSGGEEWLCPECGRNVVVRWEPEFDQLVLQEGDPGVSHAGSRRGLVGLGSVRVTPSDDIAAAVRLDSGWRDWLGAHGVEWDADPRDAD